MTKNELKIIEAGSLVHIQFHSSDRLKEYIVLTRKRRDKYRDLTQRQKAAKKMVHNEKTVEKAQIFDKLLRRYEEQYQSKNRPTVFYI